MKDEEAYLKKVAAAKLNLRRELAALPYPEKIRRVVEMQKIAKGFRRRNSKEVFVWQLD